MIAVRVMHSWNAHVYMHVYVTARFATQPASKQVSPIHHRSKVMARFETSWLDGFKDGQPALKRGWVDRFKTGQSFGGRLPQQLRNWLGERL